MDLIDVIEEAIKNNESLPNESYAEYIHRAIRPYIVTKKEFDDLENEVKRMNKGSWITDEGIDEDEATNIAREVVEEEVHTEEIKKMYNEIKKMHQEIIDKQGTL